MTRPNTLALEAHTALERLGPEWDALFEAGPGLQSRRAWFAASAAAALPGGAEPCYLAVIAPDGPAALVPMVRGPGRRWASLTTPYTCLYQPLLRPGAPDTLIRAAAATFGRYCRRWPITRLEALDPAWPGRPAFDAGLRDAGLAIRSFAHFGNWYLPVPGWSWDDYLRSRPGTLRETIRRKTRLVAREPGMRLELIRDAASLGRALAAYESVYARSWKEPEPFPAFNQELVGRLAQSGALRIGLMWSGEQPLAAQYWTVSGGVATVLKLAHDDSARQVSPGTVLTAYMVRSLLSDGAPDEVAELDFGRGDDPYKAGWTGHRRPREGLLAINPWLPAGAVALARHDLGGILRKAKSVLAREGGSGV